MFYDTKTISTSFYKFLQNATFLRFFYKTILCRRFFYTL